MTFIPALHPPQDADRRQWWFLFRDDRILIHRQGNDSICPFVRDISPFKTAIIRKHYLGYLNRTDCYTAELSRDVRLPVNSSLERVRRLLGGVSDELLGIAGRANQIIHWAQSHQFCGRCGQPTRDVKNERAKVCSRCGLINYPRVSPAIIVAVVKRCRILLARSTRSVSSYHSVLAGFVEPGETLEACVRREVKEEVGIEVKNIRYFGSQPWPFPNALMVAFTAEYAGGDLRINPSEIVDAQWYDAGALPRIPGRWSISRQLIDWFSRTHASVDDSRRQGLSGDFV